jgi:hypothetical protein
MAERPIFLLSPANCAGVRMAMVMREGAGFPLACALRAHEGAPIGELFRFASGLYFRGKLAYAERFGDARVIVPGYGLVPHARRVSIAELRCIARIPVDLAEPRYRLSLARDAEGLARRCGARPVVLLGSIASTKYTAVLLEVFGERLLFPTAFVGRGDMSRGGLMLRCARAGHELEYAPVLGAVRRGQRPPKLPRWAPGTTEIR